MKKLIKQLQEDYQVVREKAARQCEHEGDYHTARLLRECNMFKGDESIEDLILLMFTPRGIEFLTRYNFPSLHTFRKFRRFKPERYGVYIDAGQIALADPKKAFLVGNTSAQMNYGHTTLYRLHMMHGASADLTAKGYSIVKIEKDATASVKIHIEDNAKVLQ